MKIIKKYYHVAALVTKSRRNHAPNILTQKELANLVGLDSCGLIANIERGTHDIPRSKMRAYSTALSINASLILDAKAQDYRDYELKHLRAIDLEIRQKISSMFGDSNIKEGE